MNTQELTHALEKLWSRQQITGNDVDYSLWHKEKIRLREFADISGSCLFAVDVYKGIYDFASDNFNPLFGYDTSRLHNIHRQGDYLESKYHTDDYRKILQLRVNISHFMYSLPPENRNDYQNVFQFRMRNARGNYVNVISRQQVHLTDRAGKAWIVMGIMNISADQTPLDSPCCSVVNRKTGEVFDAAALLHPVPTLLTKRESEILRFIEKGMLSKEIATCLNISIHTVNNHRKNILSKLRVDNAIEAILKARAKGAI